MHKAELHEIINAGKNKGTAIKELVREGIPYEVILQTIEEKAKPSGTHAGWRE